jgi:hypothetical protein
LDLKLSQLAAYGLVQGSQRRSKWLVQVVEHLPKHDDGLEWVRMELKSASGWICVDPTVTPAAAVRNGYLSDLCRGYLIIIIGSIIIIISSIVIIVIIITVA